MLSNVEVSALRGCFGYARAENAENAEKNFIKLTLGLLSRKFQIPLVRDIFMKRLLIFFCAALAAAGCAPFREIATVGAQRGGPFD